MSKSTGSSKPRWLRHSNVALAAILIAILISSAGAGTGLFKAATIVQAQQEISFSKVFMPDTIGPGATSTLVFTIQNIGSEPETDLAFTDNLPAAVSIAAPANATSTCGGTLTAPDGGGTISLSGGQIGAESTCVIAVDVTSSKLGTHTNISGVLTWSDSENGNAVADLNVVTDLPGFSKSFAPGAVSFGGKSTLTFTIDNSVNINPAYYPTFADSLPTGMVVADPANASTTCAGGTLTAIPGTSAIAFTVVDSLYPVAAGASCTVSVDVVAHAVGTLGNVSGELTSFTGGATRSSGKASAVLDVTVGEIALIKSFADDPVTPGDTVTLEFTIHNLDRGNTATNIAFTDDLGATLAGLVAVGLPASDVCGAGSQLSGSSTLSLTGGSLAPESSCTFSATLQVPAAAASGAYTNTTSAVTADGGLEGDPGTDTLHVSLAPILTKQFVNDPIAAGDTVTLTFTISNTSPVSDVTSIAFDDELTTFFPFPLSSVGLPAAGFCGPGASMSLVSLGFEREGLSMTGGSLGPGASCTFDVALLVPAGMTGGSYTNTTGDVTAVVGDETVTGRPATDDLVVISAPGLVKSFTNDPVTPGDTVTLEFQLSLSEEAPADATDIVFTDNLSDVLAGLTAIGLPSSDVCGAGSLLAGTTDLSFTGGSLAPGESCVFSVTLQVPADAASGNYTNWTSIVTADMLGLAGAGLPAVDVLKVSDVFFTKTFVGDPVIPGGTVTLRFTISNTHPLTDATDMSFTDDLGAVLPGLVATGLPPADVCGAGSQIIGTSLLQFTGGSLPSGGTCTFDITLQVPAGTASDTYNNATSNFSVVIGGAQVVLDPAVDTLDVFADWLWLTKAFTNDPVMPDGTVTLEFTITNTHATQTAKNIGFTDSLSAALPGLAAIGLPANDVCGAGSDLSGTDLLTFSGGSLGPGASCTFSVALQVPKSAALGTYVNTTSQVTGEITGLAVRGDPGTDDLSVAELIYLPLVIRNDGLLPGMVAQSVDLADREIKLTP